MEYKLKKDRIPVCETVFDSFTELPVESDLLLPDYCPDIVKILKCQAKPALSKTQVSADQCVLEGAILLTIYYVGEDGRLRTSEHKAEFHKTLELKSAPSNPLVFYTAKEDYLNCKAVNQRRVDVRGAFTLNVRILSVSEEESVGEAQGAGLQLSHRSVQCSQLVGTAEKRFTIREDIELGQEKPPMDYLIRHSEQVRVTEWKLAGGKLIFKGELEGSLEYQPQEGEGKQTASYQLPVSQMLDVDGAGEDCICHIQCDLLWSAIHPQTDADGLTRMVAGEYTLGIRCFVLQETSVLPATDAYSTQYELQLSQKQSSLMRALGGMPQSFDLEQTVTLPEGMKEPLDFWCETGAVGVSVQEQSLMITGKLRYCMLGADPDGAPVYWEQVQEISQECPVTEPAQGYLPQLSISAEDCRYEMREQGQTVCRCRLKVDGIILGVFPVRFLTGIQVDESQEKKREAQSAMTIYYADAGENIWNIAKRYNTSIAAVMEENGLEEEVLAEKRIVLIPMVG